MADLPSGTVAFLFTDNESAFCASTSLGTSHSSDRLNLVCYEMP
jgi:hypothetical protein